MLHRIKKWLWFMVALGTTVAAAENNFTVEIGNHHDNERDAIVRQFMTDSPTITTTPDDVPILSLVLPLFADGLAARVADNIHRGCVHGLTQSGQRAKINLYATDGSAANTLAQYTAAATSKAQIIIGPMLKSNVAALLQAQPQAPLATILLQPGTGDGYFVMTLDAGQEAADLARMLADQEITQAWVVIQPGARGKAQSDAFIESWHTHTGNTPTRFYVAAQPDWQQLFNELKTVAAAQGIVLFAAGDDEFARQTRSFTPQRHQVFAASIIGGGSSELSSERLSFMEMPWFIDLGDDLSIYDLPAVRTLPIIQQRFFALGLDVCRAALAWPQWSPHWSMAGVSGDWLLTATDTFIRDGTLVSYQGGSLRPWSP